MRGDALVAQRNYIPFFVVFTEVAEDAAAVSLPGGPVTMGSSVTVSSGRSFWADVEDHGAEKTEWGSQILVRHKATCIRGARSPFHSYAQRSHLRGRWATVLAVIW